MAIADMHAGTQAPAGAPSVGRAGPRPPEVAVVAMGGMGAWIAGRLTANGASVRTVLAGRSEASAARAAAAGVRDAGSDAALVDGADLVMSIVPPAAARALADRLAPVLAQSAGKPIYIDCNAVSRSTVLGIAERIGATGCAVVDAGIMGAVPRSGQGPFPRLYLAGPQAPAVASLRDYGLDVRLMENGIGAASALKCCFAALGKGLTALAVESIMAAKLAGVDRELQDELRTHVPALARLLCTYIPDSYGKAYRWVAEMNEIADDFAGVPGGPESFRAVSTLFEALAAANTRRDGPDALVDVLEVFTAGLKPE